MDLRANGFSSRKSVMLTHHISPFTGSFYSIRFFFPYFSKFFVNLVEQLKKLAHEYEQGTDTRSKVLCRSYVACNASAQDSEPNLNGRRQILKIDGQATEWPKPLQFSNNVTKVILHNSQRPGEFIRNR